MYAPSFITRGKAIWSVSESADVFLSRVNRFCHFALNKRKLPRKFFNGSYLMMKCFRNFLSRLQMDFESVSATFLWCYFNFLLFLFYYYFFFYCMYDKQALDEILKCDHLSESY